MKIAQVYVERISLNLDYPFSYIIKNNMNVVKGTRVNINFNNSNLVGYVEDIIETDLSKEEYEKKCGFGLKYLDVSLFWVSASYIVGTPAKKTGLCCLINLANVSMLI